jgi:hypothetical protein
MATEASAFTRLQSDGRLIARLAEGDCVAKIPVANAVKKVWVALVIVLVVAVAAFCVTRLRTFFGYHDSRPIAGGISDDIKPFNPKHVVYQVFGAAGTVADIKLPGHQCHPPASKQRAAALDACGYYDSSLGERQRCGAGRQ